MKMKENDQTVVVLVDMKRLYGYFKTVREEFDRSLDDEILENYTKYCRNTVEKLI